MTTSNGVLLATLNKGKLAEFQRLFDGSKIPILSLDTYIRNPLLLSKVESTSEDATYIENVRSKCRAVYFAAKMPCIADDSGIEIDALAGKPGVVSAHFAKKKLGESQDQANRRYVLELLAGKKSLSERRARMRCILMCMMDGLTLIGEGICEGHIAFEEKGNKGFGYDPIFIPDSFGGKSFAEISEQEKNQVSHRSKAAANLLNKLKNYQLVRA